MAKKSKIAKNEQRKEIVARYAERRAELKKIIKNPNTPDEERLEAQFELNRQPRDASPPAARCTNAFNLTLRFCDPGMWAARKGRGGLKRLSPPALEEGGGESLWFFYRVTLASGKSALLIPRLNV